jgi:ATP-dependent DNA helicase RecG
VTPDENTIMIIDLLRELNELDEHPTLEAKACGSGELGNSFFETVCAFANEPDLGGGRIVLGVTKSPDDFFGGYDMTGVVNPDKILQDIASGCATTFNHPVRPRAFSEPYEGKVAIIVEVDELSPSQKPLYFQKNNLPRGAWRRIGSTDQRCTDEDLVLFFGNRQGDSHDLTIVTNATVEDLDSEAIAHYRKLRAKVNPVAEELEWDDHDLLRSLNAIRQDNGVWRPTLTGMLLFGSRMAYRRELPAVRVDYIRVPGKEWVEDPDKRFLTTVDMRGPLLQIVDRAQAAVMDDLPKGFDLKEGQIQAETPTLPARVLREAIVNALMHRSYREHRPTQIIRYSNRIEIQNAGFSLKNEDQLGEAGSQLRNPCLAAVFHETNTAETKGSGIRVMREQMKANGFSLPTFESDRANNSFTSRLLLHHFLSEKDLEWLAQVSCDLSDPQRYALIFLREQGAINNQTVRQTTGSDIMAASQDLRKLRDLGLVTQKGKGSATYYLPGPEFPHETPDRGSLVTEQATLAGKHTTLAGKLTTLTGEHTTLAPKHTTLRESLPESLRHQVEELGQRPGEKSRTVILLLCAWKPLSSNELAEILGRKDSEAIRRDHLKPLIEEGRLAYVYPEMERHPEQAYRTVGRVNL